MHGPFYRTEILLGPEAMAVMARSRVAVFGVGGVGGYVCEALARSGLGAFDLVDNDKVDLSNLNRQIIATVNTLGRPKTEAMKERILSINPQAKVETYRRFVLPDNIDDFPFEKYDYVVDAVDTVAAKLALAVKCDQMGVPIISSMGAGNKLDPTAFRSGDIYKTRMDPLARAMRRELKKRGIRRLKTVWSEEEPLQPEGAPEDGPRPVPGSVAFVPSVAGLIIAGEVVKDLTAKAKEKEKEKEDS